MTRAIALAVVMALGAAATEATGQDAAPLLRADLSSETTLPGQPVILRLTLLVPTWMPEPPELPSYDLPDLMVRLPSRSTQPVSERIDGETWSGVSRAYRLTPLVTGEIELPPQTIRLAYADPTTREPVEATLTTPAMTLTGAVPDGAEGLTPFVAAEDFELTQEIEGDPAALAPGDALVRRVTARIVGAAPVIIPPLIPAEAPDTLAVYAEEPALEEGDDRGTPTGTRTETVTVVPSGGGSFSLPPIEIRWWDITSGTVRTASAPGLELDVDGPAATAPAVPADPGARLRAGLAVIILAAAGLAAWRLRGHARAALDALRARWSASEYAAWRAVTRALRSRDLGAATTAIDVWWRRVQPASRPLPGTVVHALAAIGADHYAPPRDAVAHGGGEEGRWSDLRETLHLLRSDLRRQRSGRQSARLSPLNPLADTIAGDAGSAEDLGRT